VSRVGGNAQIKPMKKVAGRLKLDLSQYRELEAFAQFGSDLDPDTQRTLARGERLVKTLNQGERQPISVGEQVAVIYGATNGYLDRISADRVEEFNEGLQQRLRSEKADLIEKIAGGDWEDGTVSALDGAIKEYAEDFGFDLDEDGNPLEAADDAPRRSENGSGPSSEGDSGEDSDDGEEGSEDESSERETARA
jgi:F-type H+/Na+-transporting ATPase subunit alpha